MKLMIFFLLIPVITLSQKKIRGIVINSKGEPLPYTNIVSLKKNIGSITNEKGEFLIENLTNTDSIKITNVAFIPRIFAVKNLDSSNKIVLSDSIKQLDNVIIINLKRFTNLKTLGFFNYKSNGEFKLIPGNQLATFISNTFLKEGWVKGIYFKIKKFGKCQTSFRIRLIKMDTSEFNPGIDILTENITLISKNLKKINYIDLSNYSIIFPKIGLFVVIEWLGSDNNCDNNSYTSIASNLEIENNLVWLNFRDRHWFNSNRPKLPNGKFITPNIGLNVAF